MAASCRDAVSFIAIHGVQHLASGELEEILVRKMGNPITFGACAGFVHDGGGKTGVLLLPAWGFEEMTIRRGWAMFADLLSAAGYCALRFDWPGTGDSLGDAGAEMNLATWFGAAEKAAEILREVYSVERIVLIGHGIGGLLAPHVAHRVDASAIVMMAPQTEGAVGLRELDIWSRMIGSFLRLPPKASRDNVEVAGHSLSMALAKEIASLRLSALVTAEAPRPALLLLRPGVQADGWQQGLVAGGFAVDHAVYTGWDGFLSQTAASKPPLDDFGTVCRWLESHVPCEAGLLNRSIALPSPELIGPDFIERPMLFGSGQSLFGVLCQPQAQPSRAVVVMINSGDNYHIGWARMHVEFARALAARGISSFRIDTGGIGDADPVEGHLFYVERQIREVIEAVDAVDRQHLGPVVLTGRCSGGYAALQAAVTEDRVKALVAVNTARLSLDPAETFEEIMSAGTSSMADYKKRALSPRIFLDILTGKLSIVTVATKAKHILKTQLSVRFPALYGAVSGAGKLTRFTQQQARQLQERGVTSILLYADNDGGMDELARHFGKRAAEDYDHARVRIVSGAEHNMTAPFAREAILQALLDAADSAA